MGLLWNVERPSRPGGYRAVLAHHLPSALIAGVVLLAVALLPLDRIPYTICTFLRITGYPCPSCGLTRGFVAMAHGQWLAVLYACPLAALLYAATAFVFAFNTAALLCGVRLTWVFHKPYRLVKNPLPPQHVAVEVSTWRRRAVLKVSPEQETRKWLASKPEGRISSTTREKCGLTPGRWLKWRVRAWVVVLCFFGLLILLNWLYRLALGLQ